MLIKYGTGLTIALEVDDKFVVVESHSFMSVKRQKGTSPSHFLRNPTFGVISTTERLSMPQIEGGEKDFFKFLVQPTCGWLDLLASLSFPFPIIYCRLLVYSVISQDEHKAAISVSTVKH